MNFIVCLNICGDRCRRLSWASNTILYLSQFEGEIHIRDKYNRIYLLSKEDVLANDWETVE